MKITVAICTRNRCASLRETLVSLSNLHVPQDAAWDLLLVDNGSSDDTRGVVQSFEDRLPIRYLHEPRPGLSVARNCAVAASQGDYIVWTDDDVLVEPGWLAAYAKAFARWPQASFFGGKILPRLEEPSPAWLRDNWLPVATALAHRDLGDDPVRLTADTPEWLLPFGANFAVAAEDQRRLSYDAALGAAPGRSRVGEETALLKRLLQEGREGYYLPDSVVHHLIGTERQTTAYLERYYRSVGETLALQDASRSAGRPFGMPRRLWRQVPVRWMRYRGARLWSAPHLWLDRLVSYSIARGEMTYWLEARAHNRQ